MSFAAIVRLKGLTHMQPAKVHPVLAFRAFSRGPGQDPYNVLLISKERMPYCADWPLAIPVRIWQNSFFAWRGWQVQKN